MDKVERPDWLITVTAAAEASGMSPAAIEALVAAGELTPLFDAGRQGVRTRGGIAAQAAARRRRSRRASSSPRPAVPVQALDVATVFEAESAANVEASLRAAHANLSRWQAAVADAAGRDADDRPQPALRRLTIEEAAVALGMPSHDALRALQSGRLAGTRLGREWITTSAAVSAHLRLARGQ
jgi:hypothetical protein